MLTRDFNPRLVGGGAGEGGHAGPCCACSHCAPRSPLRPPTSRPPFPAPPQNLSTFVNTWCEPELEALMHKVGGGGPGLDPTRLGCVAGAGVPADVRHQEPAPGWPSHPSSPPACGGTHHHPPTHRHPSTRPVPHLQTLAYNIADAVQYPSAAEMEKRWAAMPGAMPASPSLACLSLCALRAAARRCCCPSCAARAACACLQVRFLPGPPVALPGGLHGHRWVGRT